VSFKIIMTTSVPRPCFATQHQTSKTIDQDQNNRVQDQDQDRFFLVWDWSCPKTDGIGSYHCWEVNSFRR